MQQNIFPASVYVADTGTPKGRGIFAAKPFGTGETIEVAPVVVFALGSTKLPTPIKRLIFQWGHLIGDPGPQALALGYGSLYNHNNPANMRYQADAASQTMHFIAVRDITQGEELTINYNAHGGGAEWHDDAWFQRMGVAPIVGS